MRPEPTDLPLRIVVEGPLAGVAMAMQHGDSRGARLVKPVGASPDALVFDFTVTLNGSTTAGAPRLLGPFVQGPPDGRFVYINSGTSAGQCGSPWTRRIKVPLSGLTWDLFEDLPGNGRLTARIAGVARDGGPACASVKLLPPGWKRV